MNSSKHLGRQLATIRQAKGLTQAQVGRQGTVSDIENGKDVLLSSFLATADALGLEVRLVTVHGDRVVANKTRTQNELMDLAGDFHVHSYQKPASRKTEPKSTSDKQTATRKSSRAKGSTAAHVTLDKPEKPILDAKKVKNSNLNAAVTRVLKSRLGVLSESSRAHLELAGAEISEKRVRRIVDGSAPSHWLSVRSSKKKK